MLTLTNIKKQEEIMEECDGGFENNDSLDLKE